MSIKKILNTLMLVIIANLVLISLVAATEVSKDYWVEEMKKALPTTFCESIHFFRQCYDVNEIQCIETASLSTKICLHKYINQIPDALNQPKDGAKWGNIIGQCAGENYHATLSRKFKNTAECNDINHWQ